VTAAAEGASLHSFHLGLAIAAALVALGGVVGGLGIRNPPKQEEIHARSCAGGQLVGASSEIDWREAPDGASTNGAPQPTGSPA
jgi:hypothetical protein